MVFVMQIRNLGIISKTEIGQLTINVNKWRPKTDRVAFLALQNPWKPVFGANMACVVQIRNLGIISKTKIGQSTININKSRLKTDRVALPVQENPWKHVSGANVVCVVQIRNLGIISKTIIGQLTINVNKSRLKTDRVAFPVLENP
jgi:hypothetical protein